MSSAFDVIIVGAGMIGSTIACGLARTNLNVAIVDPQPPKAFDVSDTPHIRVSAISFASEQVLKNVGAWNHIINKRACPYKRLAVNELHAKQGIASLLPDISSWARTEFNATDISRDYLGHIIENDVIHLGLHECMNEIESLSVYCPSHIVSMDLDSEVKRLTLDSSEEISARLIIGADGAQSQVRTSSNLGQYKEQYEQHAFVCTVSYEGVQEDITWESFTPHGPLAFLPLADVDDKHYASLVWYDLPEQVEKLSRMDDVALLTSIRENYPKELPPLTAVIEKASFPLAKSHALSYVKKGIALVGDAAHTINPLAGQGVNLGFLDAAVLIEELAQACMDDEDISSLAVLNRYQQKRRLENKIMMGIMDAFYYGFCNDQLPLRVARNIGLGIANQIGLAKNNVMKYAIGASGQLPKLARA